MGDEPLANDPRKLWQSQESESFRMSAEEIRQRIKQVNARARRRNRGGIQVCIFLLVACPWFLTIFHNLLPRIGIALTMVGVAYLFYQVSSSQRGEKNAAGLALCTNTLDSVTFYKAQLVRQRDFHRGKIFWSRMLVFFPGPILLFIGFAQEHPEVKGMVHLELLTFLLLTAAAFPLNRWMAGRYQKQLDELARLAQEQS